MPKTILCVWEMGLALGHLSNLKPFIERALADGHRVAVAAKQLQNIPLVFGDAPLTLFQAPHLSREPANSYSPTLSYTQLILGRFESPAEMGVLCDAWQSIFDAVEPDLVIYESAPSALIASLGAPWEKWIVGNGFAVPRCDLPYLGVFPGVRRTSASENSLHGAENRLREVSNPVLRARAQPPLGNVRELILQCQRQWLLTIPEVDAFGQRPRGNYLGLPPAAVTHGEPPDWPDNDGIRVFAYVDDCPALAPVLAELTRQGASMVVYSRTISNDLKARFPGISFASRPVNMETIYREAQLVISNGNHHTAVATFLAGIFQLALPRFLEHNLTARGLERQGWAVVVKADNEHPEPAVRQALTLMTDAGKPVSGERRLLCRGNLLSMELDKAFSQL